MNGQELLELNSAALEQRLTELENELKGMPARLEQAHQTLFNLRFRLATRQLDDTSQVRKARKEIARLKTTQSELEHEWALVHAIRHERGA